MAKPTQTILNVISPSASYDIASSQSEDEIIWSVSDDSLSPDADDDYVVLSKPFSSFDRSGLSTPEPSPERHKSLSVSSLAEQVATLNLSESKQSQQSPNPKKATSSPKTPEKRRKRKKKVTATYPTPSPSPKSSNGLNGKHGPPFVPETPSTHTAYSLDSDFPKFTGLGARTIVDDFSDRQSIISYDNESIGSPSLYEEASNFISSFLSNPDAKSDNVCRLALLQSLIIELGLATPALPDSLTSAKAYLKSRAFLNIKEYIAVREQGPEAVQSVLHSSKSALIKDIKKKRNPASLKWVKRHGLQVLLIGWMH